MGLLAHESIAQVATDSRAPSEHPKTLTLFELVGLKGEQRAFNVVVSFVELTRTGFYFGVARKACAMGVPSGLPTPVIWPALLMALARVRIHPLSAAMRSLRSTITPSA